VCKFNIYSLQKLWSSETTLTGHTCGLVCNTHGSASTCSKRNINSNAASCNNYTRTNIVGAYSSGGEQWLECILGSTTTETAFKSVLHHVWRHSMGTHAQLDRTKSVTYSLHPNRPQFWESRTSTSTAITTCGLTSVWKSCKLRAAST
jgi:hypothetical protein